MPIIGRRRILNSIKHGNQICIRFGQFIFFIYWPEDSAINISFIKVVHSGFRILVHINGFIQLSKNTPIVYNQSKIFTFVNSIDSGNSL